MRWVLPLLVMTAICCSQHNTKSKIPALNPSHWDRTVSVYVSCLGKKRYYSGSGVIANNNVVYTAEHLVRHLNECDPKHPPAMMVRWHDGFYPASILWSDGMMDVAILISQGPWDFKPLQYAWPKKGEMVCMYNAEPKRRRSCGRVQRIYPGYGYCPDESKNCYDVDTNLSSIPGNSGSAVYDYEGRLVGLLVRAKGGVTTISRVKLQFRSSGIKTKEAAE